MKKYISKLKSNIRINKNLFIFLLVIVIVGLASGSIFSSLLNTDDKSMVTEYLNNFINSVKTNNLNYDVSLINTLIFTLGYALLIWLLGISVIGFILIIVFLFIKGFTLGFSIGTLITNFKFKGVVYSLGYIVPHHVINIMIYILISSYALIVSYKLINSFRGKEINFKNIIKKYSYILIFSLILLLFTSLYEVYLVPKVMNLFVSLLK